jgi:cytochrome b subunit of formate dehydrogenase
MFETVSIFAFLATCVGIAVHWVATPAGGSRNVVQGWVHMMSLLLIEQRSSLLGALKKLCYLVAMVCFIVLAITGFYPVLIQGKHISGFLMMIHATFAPIFALCMAILAITWAGGNRFTAEDCPWMSRLLRRVTRLQVAADDRPWRCSLVLYKAAFWFLLFLTLPLVLSIVVSMFHLLGTPWQRSTLAIHRWIGMVFVIVGIIHTYLAIRLRMANAI